ncbi:MAG: hypothetical protein ABR567_09505 [Myxococcales bacterium]
MTKSIEPKKKAVKKSSYWLHIRVKLSRKQLAIARAIAFVRTVDDASDNAESPLKTVDEVELVLALDKVKGLERWSDAWSLDSVLAGALQDGLVEWEKEHLGTRSLEEHAPIEGEEELPETTPAMLALVHLVARGARR